MSAIQVADLLVSKWMTAEPTSMPTREMMVSCEESFWKYVSLKLGLEEMETHCIELAKIAIDGKMCTQASFGTRGCYSAETAHDSRHDEN